MLSLVVLNTLFLHTSPIEPMLKKRAISNDIVTGRKAHGKCALADVNCHCKMTSVMALDGVMSFLSLKTLHIHVDICDTVQLLVGFLQCNGGNLEEAEYPKCVFVIN